MSQDDQNTEIETADTPETVTKKVKTLRVRSRVRGGPSRRILDGKKDLGTAGRYNFKVEI